jgi:hypothetical protein
VLAVRIDDDELLRAEVPGGRKDRLERPAVALVGRMPDDDRTERLGDRDGLVRRAVVDDEHRIRVLPGAENCLCDVGLLVVGRHRDEGPDGPLPLRPGRRIVDEEDRLLIEVHLGRAGVARRRPRPRGHRGASRECAGSAGVLSGRERFG